MSVTIFKTTREFIKGKFCLGPSSFCSMARLWAFAARQIIFISKNSSVETSLRSITRKIAFITSRGAEVVVVSRIQFTRLTESQVITPPTLARVTVVRDLQSMSIIV